MYADNRRDADEQENSTQTYLKSFGFVPASQLRFDGLDADANQEADQ